MPLHEICHEYYKQLEIFISMDRYANLVVSLVERYLQRFDSKNSMAFSFGQIMYDDFLYYILCQIKTYNPKLKIVDALKKEMNPIVTIITSYQEKLATKSCTLTEAARSSSLQSQSALVKWFTVCGVNRATLFENMSADLARIESQIEIRKYLACICEIGGLQLENMRQHIDRDNVTLAEAMNPVKNPKKMKNLYLEFFCVFRRN
jgi:hypothetical protein